MLVLDFSLWTQSPPQLLGWQGSELLIFSNFLNKLTPSFLSPYFHPVPKRYCLFSAKGGHCVLDSQGFVIEFQGTSILLAV